MFPMEVQVADEHRPKDNEDSHVQESDYGKRDQFNEGCDRPTHTIDRIIKVEREEAWAPTPPQSEKKLRKKKKPQDKIVKKGSFTNDSAKHIEAERKRKEIRVSREEPWPPPPPKGKGKD